jgi:hypothetical protein
VNLNSHCSQGCIRGKRTGRSAEAGDRTKERLKTTAKFWEKRTLGVIREEKPDAIITIVSWFFSLEFHLCRPDQIHLWMGFLTGSLQGTTRGWLEMACSEYCVLVRSRITIPSRKIDGCPEPRIKRHGQACGGHGRGMQLRCGTDGQG